MTLAYVFPMVLLASPASAQPQEKPRPLVWGETVNGLRAAVQFIHDGPTPQSALDTASAIFPHGSRLSVRLHIENTSDKPITLLSETWRQSDRASLIDDKGKATPLKHSWYSGLARRNTWTLKPKEVAILTAIDAGVAADANHKFEHPMGPVIIGKPGNVFVRYDLGFHGEGWQGNLVTGVAMLTIRERRPEDEPPTFVGRLLFQSPEGTPVQLGQVVVNAPRGRVLRAAELGPGPFEVPECRAEPVSVYVRAPGFEEVRFNDVAVKADQVSPLRLVRAEPVRFRLVTREGRGVAGAAVRYFTRSAAKASAGPYPRSGTEGPVWATSDEKGNVVLDTLQKIDPLDGRLGNHIYFFYIEPPGLAPRFIGPLEAGTKVGDIVVGPLLQARGEVRGTAAELEAFHAAEWDQPEPMKRGDGSVGWHYAVSRQLEVKRMGDKLVFQMDDLRPGTLRIVSRFQRGSRPISHVYTRREPSEDDVVFEVELTESRSDLVVSNRKK